MRGCRTAVLIVFATFHVGAARADFQWTCDWQAGLAGASPGVSAVFGDPSSTELATSALLGVSATGPADIGAGGTASTPLAGTLAFSRAFALSGSPGGWDVRFFELLEGGGGVFRAAGVLGGRIEVVGRPGAADFVVGLQGPGFAQAAGGAFLPSDGSYVLSFSLDLRGGVVGDSRSNGFIDASYTASGGFTSIAAVPEPGASTMFLIGAMAAALKLARPGNMSVSPRRGPGRQASAATG